MLSEITALHLNYNQRHMDKENHIKKLELELLDPKVRKSPERLSELLADDFFEFNQSGGISTKESVVNGLPKCPEEKFSVRDFESKEISTDVILVHYIADREILESGKKRCTLCSSIWQKKNDKWQMIFFQGTPAKTVQ